jgi:hypothetical protein
MYAEMSYFDGYHFSHIAAHEEHQRLQRIAKQCRQAHERRQRGRRNGSRFADAGRRHLTLVHG